jgi:hypothetical protein
MYMQMKSKVGHIGFFLDKFVVSRLDWLYLFFCCIWQHVTCVTFLKEMFVCLAVACSIYHHDDHYDVITSMPAFLSKSYFCAKCKTGYDHVAKHKCNNHCDLYHHVQKSWHTGNDIVVIIVMINI